MRQVMIAGVGMTPFGKHADRSLRSLAEEAAAGALADAGAVAADVEMAFVGCAATAASGRSRAHGSPWPRDRRRHDPKDPPTLLRDPSDDYLVALARTARARAIVTGDKDLLDHPGLHPPALTLRAACELLELIAPERSDSHPTAPRGHRPELQTESCARCASCTLAGKAILAAIADHDPGGARNAMREHLATVEGELRRCRAAVRLEPSHHLGCGRFWKVPPTLKRTRDEREERGSGGSSDGLRLRRTRLRGRAARVRA